MKDRIRNLRIQLRERWESLGPQQRVATAAAVVVLGAALLVWLIHSVDQARTRLRASVSMLQAQAARLERDAVEYERVRRAPSFPVSQTDLRTLVQAQASAAGLSRALGSVEPTGADQVRIMFGAVGFADWLGWVAGLQAQRVHLEACRIEALVTPGLVSVTATVSRAPR